MRLATWNLESAKRLTAERESAFRQAMATVAADIWVLTETWSNFSPAPEHRRVAQTSEAADLRSEPDRCWVAIWAKSDLVAQPLMVHAQADRMSSIRVEIPGLQSLVVVGTVLPWMSDRLWPGDDGFCAALAEQEAAWASIRGSAGLHQFVVAGDFNQSLPHRRYYGSQAGEAALQGTFERKRLLCLTTGDDANRGTPRIDHICVGRSDDQPFQHATPGTWPVPEWNGRPITDHLGVFVDL